MKLRVLIALLIFSSGLQAQAAKVQLAKNEETQLCAVAPPNAKGELAKIDELGLTPLELKQFAKAGIDADDRSDNAQWVKWYVGSANLETLSKGPSAKKKIVKWASCEDMGRLKESLFRDLFSDARLDCEGGKFLYRFRVVNNAFKMDLYQRSETTQKMTSRFIGVDVKFTDTDSKTCPTRIMPVSPDGKELKVCLQVNSDDKTKTVGSVGLKLPDTEISDSDRKVQCKIDERFARKAKDLVAKESSAPAAVKSATTAAATSSKTRALN